MKKITLYGADWCADCLRAKAFLNKNNISFDFIDTDQNTDAALLVEKINNGKRIIPTILIDDQSFTNPDNHELGSALQLKVSNIETSSTHGAGCSLDDRSCGIERADHEVGDEGGY